MELSFFKAAVFVSSVLHMRLLSSGEIVSHANIF